MKIIERVEMEAVTDVKCDVCRCSTRSEIDGLQFATLHAHWVLAQNMMANGMSFISVRTASSERLLT